jgi:dTDP-glucose 4,6-dehydratase
VDKAVSERSLLNPTSPYSVSKAAFDLHLVAMHKTCGLPMNIIRPSNCYAPGQQLHRIIPKALIYGLTGRKLPLHGGGVARKSYLHATDLSRAILKVIEKGGIGEIYNVGPDHPISIREVIAHCAKALSIDFDDLVNMAPERTGQDSCYWLDSTKIKALGWEQKIRFDGGIYDMLNWIRKYPELLTMPTDFRMRA